MNRLSSAILVPLILCGAFLAIGSARSGEKQPVAVSSYRRSELASSTFEFAGVYALSENGVAVGSFGISSPSRWVNGNLEWYDEKLSGEATCVSDSGEWLGGSLENATLAFRKHADAPLELLPPLEFENSTSVNAFVTGIRGDGTAVGVCAIRVGDDVVEHAVLWTAEGDVLPLLPNAASSSAYAINEAGTIVGAVQSEPGSEIRPFVLNDGVLEDPASAIDGDIAARAISGNGNVVGTGFKEGFGSFWFLSRGGQLTFIPLPNENGGSTPSAVNDAGLIVGNLLGDGPVAWLDGRFYNLNSLLPRSDTATLISARDVTRYAEIAANANERIGIISERFTANVLQPLRIGPDLQGSLQNVRISANRTGGRRFVTITGALRIVNAGSEPSRSTVAALEVTTRESPARRRPDRRLIAIPALAPGQAHSVNLKTALLAPRRPAGVQITLDAKNRVLETDEANNAIEAPLP